ncbi:hypothetical protein ACN47E_006204 [Coniothyrium glycines]
MAATQHMRMSRLDLDLDSAPDEELPGYEASTAPAYESGAYDEPLVTYRLRQYDRKIQMLAAQGVAAASSYRFTTHGFRLFSRKPEMEVLYTSQEMRQRMMATISYQSDGPLPWRPRAYFNHTASDGRDTRCDMESRNFVDWSFVANGRTYIWRLAMGPVSLVLAELGMSVPIARFTYSEVGALAERGAEIGELTIFRDWLTVDQNGIDWLVCGLMVALTYAKKMGKYYRNEANDLERRNSLTRELSPVQRASLAGAPSF